MQPKRFSVRGNQFTISMASSDTGSSLWIERIDPGEAVTFGTCRARPDGRPDGPLLVTGDPRWRYGRLAREVRAVLAQRFGIE